MNIKTKAVLLLLCLPMMIEAQQQVLNKDRNAPRASDETVSEKIVKK